MAETSVTHAESTHPDGTAPDGTASVGASADTAVRAVTVRFFAAAKAAAGTGEATVRVTSDATVDELLGALGEQFGPELSAVVRHSSFLLDGVGVQRSDPVGTASGLDILPPFAGG